MHFSTFSAGFALLTCRFDSLLWKIIPVLLDSGNKVEFFRRTKNEVWVSRKNSTLFPESSKSGIIFHSALSNLQVRNAKRTEKVEKCISLELLFFLTERKYSLTLNCQESTIYGRDRYIALKHCVYEDKKPTSFGPNLSPREAGCECSDRQSTQHIGPALMHSESAKKIEFIGLKWLGYYVEQGSALGFEVFQFFLIEILLQSWKK